MKIEDAAVRVTVEPCRELYNEGKRLDIMELDFEVVLVVSAMELTELRSDNLLEKTYDLFLGNLRFWGRTGDSINGD